MELTPTLFLGRRKNYLPILEQLQRLYQEMDQSYDGVAAQYGFICNGCTENCCQTRFYHHTLLEYLYLMEGLQGLSRNEWQTVRETACRVNQHLNDADRQGKPARIMCPLNLAERCRLYPHRPMICRLHGIPHELHPPGGHVVRNPGCDAFLDQCRARGKTDYLPFDRTPYYRRMAMLERELRQKVGYAAKIKLTIAQMIATMDPNYEINIR